MLINYPTSNDNMIDKVFCQCISDNMTEMDQCMRINCPCEQTDCALHNDNQMTKQSDYEMNKPWI